MLYNFEIFCDFDGTITQIDTIDYILENIADKQYLRYEELWLNGKIGSKECMQNQIKLINGGFKAITKLLDSLKIDSTFANFMNWTTNNEIALSIVSDGLDRVINYILFKEKLNISRIYSNKLIELPNNQLAIANPHSAPNCLMGVCKCTILNASNKIKVAIGDGASDYCFAGQADIVFAKSKLLKHCQENNLPHIPFNNFNDIIDKLTAIAQSDISNYIPNTQAPTASNLA